MPSPLELHGTGESHTFKTKGARHHPIRFKDTTGATVTKRLRLKNVILRSIEMNDVTTQIELEAGLGEITESDDGKRNALIPRIMMRDANKQVVWDGEIQIRGELDLFFIWLSPTSGDELAANVIVEDL